MTVRTVGLRELRQALIAASRAAEDEVAAASVEAAEVVAGAARRRAPAGPHEGGGRVVPVRLSIASGREHLAGTVSMGGPRSPHAEVVNFGGHIPRRGADRTAVALARRRKRSFASTGVSSLTRVVGREFLYASISSESGRVEEIYADAVDRVFARAFPN